MLTILRTEKHRIECQPSQLRVNGTAVLKMWGGGIGRIEMSPIYISVEDVESDEQLIELIKDQANDNGFGCENIESLEEVQVDVLSNYKRQDDTLSTLVSDSFFYDEIKL